MSRGLGDLRKREIPYSGYIPRGESFTDFTISLSSANI